MPNRIPPLKGNSAFVLTRSTNKNQIVYAVDFNSTSPVHPYWEMLEKDGHSEELTAPERLHFYGVDVLERSPFDLVLKFRALPTLAIHVRLRAGVAVASVHILGAERELRGIFLRLTNGFLPSLDSVEIDCGDESDHSTNNFFTFSPSSGVWKAGRRNNPDTNSTRLE